MTDLLARHQQELRTIDDGLFAMRMFPLLGEEAVAGQVLIPVVAAGHEGVAEQIGLQFKRELSYDFNPFDLESDTLLITSTFQATFPVVAGAVGMDNEDDHWVLRWAWLHPYERGPRHLGRGGQFALAWDQLEERYGDFYVEGPYSQAMYAFMKHRGISPSRFSADEVE
ncbi:hypothetical protein ACH47X_08085 [Promicromonospora kroppenstedtii]|uniref:Uncharacterized protein n=1 Tax=Promicromonospora kroppenstedtii TaxID=440482 RepID=A0ABW7XH59_9MICO